MRHIGFLALIVVLIAITPTANAFLSYERFMKVCEQPNDFCYGLLFGVLESEGIYRALFDSRYSELSKELGREIKPGMPLYASVLCLSDADLNKSVREITEDMRRIIVGHLSSVKKANPSYSDRMRITGTGQNYIMDALLTGYACDLPGRAGASPVW